MSKAEPKHLTWTEFEALRPSDIVHVRLIGGAEIIRASVASVDTKSGYININLPSGVRALVTCSQCYQNV